MQSCECGLLLLELPSRAARQLSSKQIDGCDHPSREQVGYCPEKLPFLAALPLAGFARAAFAIAPAFHVGGECRKNCADLEIDIGIGKRQLCEGLARLGDLSSQIAGASGLLAGPRGTL